MTFTWGMIVAVATTIGGVVGYVAGLWKQKEEIALLRSQREKVEQELAELRLDAETRAARQVLLLVVRTQKQIVGKKNLAFSEDALYSEMGEYAPRLHAVLDVLQTEGRAKSPTGTWIIE